MLLTVSGGVPNEFGVVLFGAGPAQIPMENGCFLLASTLLMPVLVFVLDFKGEAAFQEVIAADHASCTFASQAFMSDPGTPRGFANTNGVEFVIL